MRRERWKILEGEMPWRGFQNAQGVGVKGEDKELEGEKLKDGKCPANHMS